MDKQRIEELMKQASTTRVSGFGETDILDPVKFAELIVKECARSILSTPVDYSEIDTMHKIRDNVKKHFGVEE